MRTKALLAILFAGGMLNTALPACPTDKVESTESVVKLIENNKENTSEIRAYQLLQLAQNYLDFPDRTAAEAPLRAGYTLLYTWRWQNGLVYSADQLCLRSRNSETNQKKKTEKDSHSPSAENSELANNAVEKALSQLDQNSNKFAKLNLYLIASRLFLITGNADGAERCNKVLDDAFKSCEEILPADKDRTRANVSVLNSVAYGLLPVRISDLNPAEKNNAWDQHPAPIFTEKDFVESEKIKLRAAAIADRLPSTSDTRRKTHRDLAIWYKQLGKTAGFEKQKQIVFDLVGINDDRILYPQRGSCGHLVWWTLEKQVRLGSCGIG